MLSNFPIVARQSREFLSGSPDSQAPSREPFRACVLLGKRSETFECSFRANLCGTLGHMEESSPLYITLSVRETCAPLPSWNGESRSGCEWSVVTGATTCSEARLDSIWLIGCFGSLLQSRDSLAFRPSPRAGTGPSKQVMEGKVQEETVKYLSDRYGRWHNER